MTTATADPTRFVLPDDAPFLANMAALWSVDPALAEAIESLHPAPSYPIQLSKSGFPTVSVPAPGGRMVAMHSRYQPVDEAKRLVERIETADRTAFYIFGFGLGYHVEFLFDKAGKESLFVVFEPDLLLLRTAFEARDVSPLIESRRVHFIQRCDKGALLTRLTPLTALISVGAEIVIHPPSMEVAGDFHKQMQAWLEEYAAFSRTSLNTVVLNSRKTAENISQNLAWYVASPPLSRLKDRHKGKPAVIVSAGPSLRKNQHLLKGLEDRAVIISVQTMLQPLLEMGVEPHYVTSLDYHDICTRFFEKLPRKVKTELVAEPKASSEIFRMYPGPVSLLGNRFAELMLREMKLAKPELQGGATVAHLAFYLAEFIGADPIIFVGQDLGFSDGLCYTPGTSYEDVWRPEMSRFCSVEM
ncbi:MAG TPA: 6-hydroxymethylpterin diphosphokinase MptE-like protein, partial [Tepidisphaeraceae bacterium]|nr:6-hydroxymethylpterin diphosphokinase MptE-like protein [Tepidisphaeraceae bacterium]